jgi:Protein of unknown function (DUF2642)
MGLLKARTHSTCFISKHHRRSKCQKIKVITICPTPKKRKKLRRPRRISLRRLQRLLLSLSDRIEMLTGGIASITSFVNQIRNDVNALQNQISDLTAVNQDIRNTLQARVGTSISIETPAGSVNGILLAVGDDFVEVEEATGAIAIVRIAKINFFR